jgi:hypothetical protein
MYDRQKKRTESIPDSWAKKNKKKPNLPANLKQHLAAAANTSSSHKAARLHLLQHAIVLLDSPAQLNRQTESISKPQTALCST